LVSGLAQWEYKMGIADLMLLHGRCRRNLCPSNIDTAAASASTYQSIPQSKLIMVATVAGVHDSIRHGAWLAM
jgi:hypothetical protein